MRVGENNRKERKEGIKYNKRKKRRKDLFEWHF